MTKTVLEKLKEESLRIRKEKGELASFSVFAISEIEKVGKANGNRLTTNDEAITAVKKMIGVIESNMALVKDDFILLKLKSERDLLLSVLPAMASIEDVKKHVNSLWTDVPSKGDFMKEVKAKFGSLVDMKEVGNLYTQLYEGK